MRAPVEITGEDGHVALVGEQLVLSFADKATVNALKRAVRVRAYPLAAVADVQVDPAGHRGHPTLRVVPRPGTDLLRRLLKAQELDPAEDPDTLVLTKGGTVPAAQAFAAGARARAAAAALQPPSGPVNVLTGRVPMTVSGTGTRATFDGTSVTLEVSSWTSAPAKKNGYPRRIPLDAIADVVIRHPKLTGQLRFVLAGGPGADINVNPKTDLDTVELHADNSQSYAVFAAAVLTAARWTRQTVHPELLSATPSSNADLVGPTVRSEIPGPLGKIGTEVEHTGPVAVAPESRSAIVPTSAGLESPAASHDATAPARVGWSERRAQKRQAKQEAAAEAAWLADQVLLDKLARAAQAATGPGGGADSGVILKAGEVALWMGQASLIEPRRQQGHYQGSYSGVSFRIAKGVRYTVGGSRGHYVPGPEVQTPVDSGRAVVTTQRVLFIGGRSNREWAYSKLVSVDSSANDATVLLSVSNRQKVSGLHLGKSGTEFTHFLALGVAVAQHGAPAVAAECLESAEAHRTTRP